MDMDMVVNVMKNAWYLPPSAYSGKDGWMHPYTPWIGATMYLLGKPIFRMLCKALNTTGKSTFFTFLVVLHNFVLMAFSALVWYESWQVVHKVYNKNGLQLLYCDSVNGGELWSSGMGRLAFLFYLSKYYEFIDTMILVVKQKHVMLLQSYHHAGAVLTMWYLTYTQATSVMWFVCLNSMIHTVMYTYYMFSAMGLRFSGKSLITTCQLIQFFTGILATAPYFYLHYATGFPKCQTDDQIYALACVHAYVFPLIAMFAQFYIKSYTKKAQKTKQV